MYTSNVDKTPINLNFEHTCTNSHQEDATHSNEPVKTDSQPQSSEVAPKVNSSNGVVQSEMVDDPKWDHFNGWMLFKPSAKTFINEFEKGNHELEKHR